MSIEAHKLIGISLSKIAQSRASRGGVSLHKNLLVATVLHKARYIFMEEAYQLVNGNNKMVAGSSSSEAAEATERVAVVDGAADEHKSPPSYQAHIELTYLNLDKCNSDNGDENGDGVAVGAGSSSENSLKRGRVEWEVEEAVMSILPKRAKAHLDNVYECDANDDFIFLDDFLPDNARGKEAAAGAGGSETSSMEIDRLSSLVSIFGFANLNDVSGVVCEEEAPAGGKTAAPDQCSAQAKDNKDAIQPMPSFLAMTV